MRMWGDLQRNVFWMALCALVFSFGLGVTMPTPVFADSAQRDNDTITYQQHTFKPVQADTAALSARGLPEGTHLYEYALNDSERQVIAFAPETDHLTSTSATFIQYTFTPPDTFTKSGDAKTITVNGTGTDKAASESGTDQQSEQTQQQDDKKDEEVTTSCSGTSLGSIGWIVCPVSNFMAWIADKLYDQVTQYLAVQPLQSTSEGSLFRFWSIMRDIANIAFIVVSMLVIYSQTSGIGISSYGIKRMFPRLVAAIIVVNVSFWICALAIDLSNMLGFQLQRLCTEIASTVRGADYNTLNKVTWANVISGLLTGSTATAGAAIGMSVLVGATDGALALAIPVLVGVLISIIIAAVIVAARQALVTILVIISPLAFVLYVLPSTEKYFEKWKDLFTTMLVMFPLMSLLFGGSRLAGIAILTNGYDAGSLNMVILGLAVQVAPLVLTPFIVKFSGSLLGKLGAVMNNPKRGVIDRSRNWAQQRADLRKSKVLAGDAQKNWLGNVARKRALKKRMIQQRTEAYNRRFETMADSTAEGRDRALYDRYTDLRSEETKARHDRSWHTRVLGDDELRRRTINARLTADEAKNAASKTDVLYEELRLGGDVTSSGMDVGLGRRAYAAAETQALTEVRAAMAQREVRARIDRELLADGAVAEPDGTVLRNDEGVALRRRTIDGQSLQEYATGIGHRNLMVANQTARVRKEFGEHVAAEDQLMTHFKLNSAQWQQMAASGDAAITLTDANGNRHTFRADNEYVKEAAIEHQFRAGSAGQKREIIRETGRAIQYMAEDGTIKTRQGYNYEARSTVSQAAIASGVGNVVPFVNDVTFDAILRGDFNGVEAEKMHALRQVFEGRLKAENFAGANDGALELIYSIPNMPDYQQVKASYLQTLSPQRRAEVEPTFDQVYAQRHQALRHDAYRILHTPELRRNTNAANREVYERFAERPGE